MPEKSTKPGYHPRYLLSPDYYVAVVKTLIEGLHLNFAPQRLADFLNGKGLRTPTKKPWQAASVTHLLHRIRNNRERPSRFHKELIRAVFEGKMTVAECTILFERQEFAK